MLKLRKMTGEDKPAIMRILRNTPEFLPEEVVVAEEVIDAYLFDPAGSGYYALVAEDGPTIWGYVCYGTAPMTQSTWDIYWIAVARESQGKGIGRQLTAAAEEHIRQFGGKLIMVETSSKENYQRTRRFYQSLGYHLVCQIVDFYAPGDDKVLYEKRFP
jgi:ribosomal protein S18 acetylase RimI-like enzyme